MILVTHSLTHLMNDHLKQRNKQTIAIKNILNRFSIEQLKNMITFIEAFQLRKKQEEEERMLELEKKKVMEEMMRQRIIETYFGARSGPTSVLKDFYSDRM